MLLVRTRARGRCNAPAPGGIQPGMNPARRLLTEPAPSDEELLRSSAAGEDRAFRTLFDRHYRAVFRVAFGVLLDGAEARDVAQEAFVRLHRQLPQWRPQAQVRTWLYRVTLNEALGVRRRLRSFHRHWREDRPRPGLEHAVAVQQTSALLQRELSRLSPKQRAVLTLHFEADLMPTELAPLVGMTANSARVTLHRALEQLRAHAAKAGLELPTDDPRVAAEEE
jgi:RNA polymerase sigma-70 factor (ECF subfamily)